MRRLTLTALLAVPLLLFASFGKTSANPTDYGHFGCAGIAFKIFPHMHQHGPLFNYGPYYGYYPFKPYGPWDAYLRYDPFFYGDPYANWNPREPKHHKGPPVDPGNMYGWNKNLPERGERGERGGRGERAGLIGRGWGHGGLPGFGIGFRHGCASCGGFFHASWLHGGWFRGHDWLHLPHLHVTGLFHKSCKSCGGVAQAAPLVPIGDATARFIGFGVPEQSAMFYSGTATLDPTLDLPATE